MELCFVHSLFQRQTGGEWIPLYIWFLKHIIKWSSKPKIHLNKQRSTYIFTIFFPDPVDDLHPAKQAVIYVIPLSPHTGSHWFNIQLQSELQLAIKLAFGEADCFILERKEKESKLRIQNNSLWERKQKKNEWKQSSTYTGSYTLAFNGVWKRVSYGTKKWWIFQENGRSTTKMFIFQTGTSLALFCSMNNILHALLYLPFPKVGSRTDHGKHSCIPAKICNSNSAHHSKLSQSQVWPWGTLLLPPLIWHCSSHN